jgi:hypothetical protein
MSTSSSQDSKGHIRKKDQKNVLQTVRKNGTCFNNNGDHFEHLIKIKIKISL